MRQATKKPSKFWIPGALNSNQHGQGPKLQINYGMQECTINGVAPMIPVS